jgi:hypothetical protein
MSHTPGPWTFERCGPGWAEGNWRIVLGDRSSTETEGCFSEEDARLIASSPRLLDALKRALPYVEDSGHPQGADLEEAMAAIAEAEGR